MGAEGLNGIFKVKKFDGFKKVVNKKKTIKYPSLEMMGITIRFYLHLNVYVFFVQTT